MADILTPVGELAREQQPLTKILTRMVETRLKSFPVVNEQQVLTGVIARRDLIKVLKLEE